MAGLLIYGKRSFLQRSRGTGESGSKEESTPLKYKDPGDLPRSPGFSPGGKEWLFDPDFPGVGQVMASSILLPPGVQKKKPG